MLSSGTLLTLTIEKPAAGGRMIARTDGQVVLVAGAIPGERVVARVDRVGRGVAYAETLSVERPSADRRESVTDPLCGGCLYAHISYPRQLLIKAQVVADAFARIGGVVLAAPVHVATSPDEGYRMRAQLHLRGGRIGFFRAGTNNLCDSRGTRQLLPVTCDVLERLSAGLRSAGADGVHEVELAENLEASQRVVHLHAASSIDSRRLARLAVQGEVSGLTFSYQTPAAWRRPSTRQSSVHLQGHAGPVTGETAQVLAGDPYVTDVLSIAGCPVTLRRHVLAFFQSNRYLVRDLVAHVVGHIAEGSGVIDLYAGAGAFSIAAAVARNARVTAVEGDRVASRDLEANARTAGREIKAIHQAVEVFTRTMPPRPDTLIVDPPRTGMSREAVDGVMSLGARQVVYVSCDVATLARDARRLLSAGYAIERVDAFDLFPNTPHVESVVIFQAQSV